MAKVKAAAVSDLPETDKTRQTGATGENADVPYEISDVLGDEATKTSIVEYLGSEVVDVRDGNDRSELEERWKKWRRLRRGRPESAERSTPWTKSANVMPPLTAQKVNTIYSKEIGAFSAKKPPVQVDAMNITDVDKAESLQRFFKGLSESRNGLNMGQNLQRICYEQVSMGTQPVKVPFLIDQWAFKRVGEGGSEQVKYVRHQGPAVVPIRLEDFFTRPYWKDVQRAPWVAIRYRYFKHELEQQVAMGAFDPEAVETVIAAPLTKYDENLEASQETAGVDSSSMGKAVPNQEYEIYECYLFWDVDGDGTPEDLKIWFEPETKTILRSEYNPLSIRDIEVIIYQDDPDNLYGFGVCEMTETLQDEVTALHNMRLDGTQLAMLKMFRARRGAGITDVEFSPLKIIEMDEPSSDLVPIDFMDVAPSCLSGEMVAREYADKVTGASDYMAGFNDKIVGSGASVGGTMFLAQQGNTILSGILQNAENSISNIYQIAFYQCVAHKDQLDLSFLSHEDQVNVMEVLSMNVEDIPTKFRFIVKATDISKTDESKKQGFLSMSQVYGQYIEKVLQLLQLKGQLGMDPAATPEMLEFVNKAYIGSTEFVSKMLEYFDIGNPQDYVPFVEHLKMQQRVADEVRSEQVIAQKEVLRNAANGEPIVAAGQGMGNAAGVGAGPQVAGPAGAAGPVAVSGPAQGTPAGASGIPGGGRAI